MKLVNLGSLIVKKQFFLNPAQSLRCNSHIGCNVILRNTLHKMLMLLCKSYVSLFGSFGVERGKMVDHHHENLLYGQPAKPIAILQLIVKNL